jgi:hypothetical protein
MDRLTATRLAGTTDPYTPVFSPDGQWIAFYENADNALKKVSIHGGPPVTLCNGNSSPPP